MKRTSDPVKPRLMLALVGFFCGFTGLAVRALDLHLFPDQRVARIQKSQKGMEVVLSPQRGKIFDSKGRVLAMAISAPSVFADPSAIENRKKFARAVAPLLKMSSAQILSKIDNPKRKFTWLKRRVDPAVGEKLKSMKLAGLHFTEEGTRLYPDRELAAQVIGVVGSEGGGLEGIERAYDHLLRSQVMVVRADRDARGRAIYTDGPVLLEPEPGADLYLTIDATIQHTLEKELMETASAARPRFAMGIVMEPTTGKILAMASYPRVNPNRLDQSSPEQWRNRPVEEVFEPGSTFKVFSLAAALEAGALLPTDSIDCRKGSLRVSGKMIRTLEDHEWLHPREILKFSDNIGTSRVALRLGRTRLYDTLRDFGFGSKVGIDFPAEARGMLAKGAYWRDVELANISFGQGVGVTAVQMISALSAVANDGIRVRPYLVEKAMFPDGRELDLKRNGLPQRVISTQTAQTIRHWMEAVSEPDGTGAKAAIPGYQIAGKTGTAQKVDPATGEYTHRLVASSFMGFAPSAAPRLSALILFDEPAKADMGGMIAAPVFQKVMEASLAYLGVAPDVSSSGRIAQASGQDLESPPLPSDSNNVASVVESSAPDFRGLTVREVLDRAREFSVRVHVVGSGVAVRQELAKSGAWKVIFAEGERI